MNAIIPFSGFYNSIHDAEMDRALESLVQDERGEPNAELMDRLWSHVDLSDARREYAKRYTEDFATYFSDETGVTLKLRFDEVSSPREYNFQTDRIFVKLSRDAVRRIFRAVDKAKLESVCERRHTSCSGFISYYTPDWKDWGTVDKWDHNQVQSLIIAMMETASIDSDWEWNIVEDWSGNGVVDNWVYDGLDAEGKRVVEVADYLRKRERRASGFDY